MTISAQSEKVTLPQPANMVVQKQRFNPRRKMQKLLSFCRVNFASTCAHRFLVITDGQYSAWNIKKETKYCVSCTPPPPSQPSILDNPLKVEIQHGFLSKIRSPIKSNLNFGNVPKLFSRPFLSEPQKNCLKINENVDSTIYFKYVLREMK